MSNKTIRTHTERLEKVIEQGVELRDEMRSKIANLEKIVSAQKAEIINATRAKELYKRRLANYKRTLVAEREKRQKLEGKLIKLNRRIIDA
ncbi:TPA: hypothetical protein ACLKPI_003501 [Klebsiella pneumoniae]|uniref:hypothetical protein n=1 Tax=Klebsiella pneumoniae TaxID=573 RepID=UPI000EFC35A8|nr:hypothetical protein [Klebsiella pneumoniae]MCB8851690.1 hypothetical protein [Klebsiella pneumoniae]MCB8869797.1 hypothetical protein [Klebsiella pneumoniae]MDD1048830.1 hypothetical protein [Klebsiella pneumoniae]MDD1093876.1 hypothetical protein [Klebsiella pneumoniae]MDD1099408.1 hypothetical protein [Klebsiella pneumoniae]